MSIFRTWCDRIDSGMWEEDGDDYVNPIQLACCPQAKETPRSKTPRSELS